MNPKTNSWWFPIRDSGFSTSISQLERQKTSIPTLPAELLRDVESWVVVAEFLRIKHAANVIWTRFFAFSTYTVEYFNTYFHAKTFRIANFILVTRVSSIPVKLFLLRAVTWIKMHSVEHHLCDFASFAPAHTHGMPTRTEYYINAASYSGQIMNNLPSSFIDRHKRMSTLLQLNSRNPEWLHCVASQRLSTGHVGWQIFPTNLCSIVVVEKMRKKRKATPKLYSIST